jgi:hypothetical protein
MGLTTERKVFFGLMVVAGAALVIDQGFLGPSGASADDIAMTADMLVEQEPISEVQPAAQPAAAILIDRLRSTPDTGSSVSLGSAFSLTKMIGPKDGLTDQQEPQGESSDDGQGDSFPLIAPRADDLPVLSAVMPSSNGGGALLGGKLVRVGQVGPNGYLLVLVHARAVLVERDGIQYAIEIPTVLDQD